MVRDGHIQSNPMDHIETPKRTTWAPKPLQPEDLAAVAKHASTPAATARNPWPERDEALFALLIAGGLRISEVAGLQIGDCYLKDDPPRITVNHLLIQDEPLRSKMSTGPTHAPPVFGPTERPPRKATATS